jgi:hypothetical protein
MSEETPKPVLEEIACTLIQANSIIELALSAMENSMDIGPDSQGGDAVEALHGVKQLLEAARRRCNV